MDRDDAQDPARPAMTGHDEAANFDRVRPRRLRTPADAAAPRTALERHPSAAPRSTPPLERTVRVPVHVSVDEAGKRALFSAQPTQAAPGSIMIECSRCSRTTVLGAMQALRVVIPSVHLFVPGVRHRSFLRCPACNRFSWVRLRMRL